MADQTRKAVFELRIEAGPALAQFEKINAQLDANRYKRTQLTKEITANFKAEEKLRAEMAASGTVTEAQAAKLKNLQATQVALNREKAKSVIVDKALSAESRELTNDLSLLTEKGLRFRDKMAAANLEAITSSGLLGQLAAKSRGLEQATAQVALAIEKSNAELTKYNDDLKAGLITEEQHAKATADLNAELRKSEEALRGTQQELDANKAKTAALEKEVLDLKAAFDAGQISAEEYKDGLKRLEDTTAGLGNKFDSFVKNQGAELKSTLSSMAVQYVGVAAAVGGVVAVVGNAIDTVIEFDSALASVTSLGKDYKDRIDELSAAARDMGPKFGVGATEAVAAIEALAKAGVTATDILGGGLEGALTLARAGSIDVGQAAEIAASAMTQFGLAGGQVTHIADLLAAGANKAQGGVDDLGAALNQAGVVANSTGVSIEESVGALSAFASAGLIGSDAGTSFKTMLQALIPRSEDAAKAMEANGIAAYDAQGNFIGLTEYAGRLQAGLKDMSEEQRAATLKTIFGSDAVRAATVLYNQGAGGIAKWVEEVNKSGFAADIAKQKQDTLQGSLDRAGAAWQNFVLSIENGQGALAKAVRGSIDILSNFLEFFGGTAVEVASESFAQKVQEGIAKSFGRIELNMSEDQIAAAFERASIAVTAQAKESTEFINNRIQDYSTNIAGIIETARNAGRDLTNDEKFNVSILRGQQEQLLAVLRERGESTRKVSSEVVAATELEGKSIKELTAELKFLEGQQAGMVGQNADLLAANRSRVSAIKDQIAKLNEQAGAESKVGDEVVNVTGSVAALNAEVAKLSASQAQSTTSEQFAEYQRQIDDLQKSIEAITQPVKAGGVAFDPLSNEGPQFGPVTEEQAAMQSDAAITANLGDEVSKRMELYKAEEEAHLALQSAKVAAVSDFAGALGSLAKEGTAVARSLFLVQKAMAVADVITKTQQGIVAAQAASAQVPAFIGPLPNPSYAVAKGIEIATIAKLKIAAASSLATIAAQAIAGFAGGGEAGATGNVTPSWGPRIRRGNGDNVLATLRTGEKVLNERQQRRAEAIAGRDVWGRIGLPGYAAGGRVRSVRGTAVVNARLIEDEVLAQMAAAGYLRRSSIGTGDPGSVLTAPALTTPRPSPDAVVNNQLLTAIVAMAERPIFTRITEVADGLQRQATITELTTA